MGRKARLLREHPIHIRFILKALRFEHLDDYEEGVKSQNATELWETDEYSKEEDRKSRNKSLKVNFLCWEKNERKSRRDKTNEGFSNSSGDQF